MSKKTRKKWIWILISAFALLLAVVYIYPVLMVFFNSVKTYRGVMISTLSLPEEILWENYIVVWKKMEYGRLFFNNLWVTIMGVAGIIFLGSITGYKLSRTKTKVSNALYMLCIAPMMIPFQAIMVTLLKVMSGLKLSGSIWGLGIQYWGFGVPMAIFMYHGFTKSIPVSLDESAMIDGAKGFTLYFRIIFPLLKPITATLTILNVMYIWNDYLLPLVMVNNSRKSKTLTLAATAFIGEYSTDWQYAMAAVVLAVAPSIIFFLTMQKHIIKGVVAGAVKG